MCVTFPLHSDARNILLNKSPFQCRKEAFFHTLLLVVSIMEERLEDPMTAKQSIPCIAVLGGDKRQICAAQSLGNKGFSVYTWGTGTP
ncbi:MAG: hypothetical protein E7643_03100, partial [Ruminococcaceae bacterium]|nr:hypothetical protein [Oscillospiraceae bacterium]